MAKSATFFAIFPVYKDPSTSEVICRCRSTYEGCDLVPLVISSIGDSELFINFQEASARLFSSPEPKAQGELLPSASVRRASCDVRHVLSTIASNDISSETAKPRALIFDM